MERGITVELFSITCGRPLKRELAVIRLVDLDKSSPVTNTSSVTGTGGMRSDLWRSAASRQWPLRICSAYQRETPIAAAMVEFDSGAIRGWIFPT